MGKMKEYQMKQQEENWWKGVVFDDLIDIDTITDPKFKAIIITTIDGEHHRATQEEITEINGLNIKYQKYINKLNQFDLIIYLENFSFLDYSYSISVLFGKPHR